MQLPGKFIEKVSINEVVWSLLSGHHGPEVELQHRFLKNNWPKLIINPDFQNQKENYIRWGAIAKCAGSSCPVINLLLKQYPKKKWNENLTFARIELSSRDFLNLKNINENKTLQDFAIEYQEPNKKIEQIRRLIRAGKFNIKEFKKVVAWNKNDDWFVIDGTHCISSLALEHFRRNIKLPPLKIICLEQKIRNKNSLFDMDF